MGYCHGNCFQTYSNKCFILVMITAAILTQTATVERIERDLRNTSLSVSTHDLIVLVQGNRTFEVLLSGPLEHDIAINLVRQHESLVALLPNDFTIIAEKPQNQTITIIGIQPGHLEITAKSVPDRTWIVDDLFVRVTVANSEAIIYVSIVVGWIYFMAWSVSFYPQMYKNFKKRSVVGLNFDFLALNIVGFMMYSIFNCGLYWVPEIQAEYESRHPRSLIPVLLNDVVFSLHASFATLLMIGQCFIYERGNQRVSKIASVILVLFASIVLGIVIMAAVDVIQWLDFLYYCSYIKLTVTVIKYVPQAVMNYRRKSTTGWSIGNILLDLTGSVLSMLQMILNAYNYDDWISIFGDPTKFGLGLISVPFDVLFILQHYVFYRHTKQISNSTLTNGPDVVKVTDDKPRY